MRFLRRKPLRVNVLGAGPSGLMAAWAAHLEGYEVTVFSAPAEGTNGEVAKSDLFGCQYLHVPIPGITDFAAVAWVKYLLSGSVADYRAKVYGPVSTVTVSPDEYGPEEEHSAWDLRKAYDTLFDWASNEDLFASCRLTAHTAGTVFSVPKALTISTIPAPALCVRPDVHSFASQEVWAMGSRSQHDGRMPYVAPDFTVECNGEEAPRWYRAATVFGYSTVEWPAGKKPPIAGVAAVKKPLSTDCDCHLGNRSMRAGRYGRWTKGVLTHTAFYDTLQRLKELS